MMVARIAVGLEAVAKERRRPRPGIGRGRDRRQARVEGANAGFAADRDRRAADAGLGDDIDDAADRVVAIEHRATVAARDLYTLDRIERNGRQIDAGQVDVIHAAAVDQDQRIGGGKRAKPPHVDRGAYAVYASLK